VKTHKYNHKGFTYYSVQHYSIEDMLKIINEYIELYNIEYKSDIIVLNIVNINDILIDNFLKLQRYLIQTNKMYSAYTEKTMEYYEWLRQNHLQLKLDD